MQLLVERAWYLRSTSRRCYLSAIALCRAAEVHKPRQLSRVLIGFVFFFQAEDGIRDDLVTGVQTCALPILSALLAVYREDDTRAGQQRAHVGRDRAYQRRAGEARIV